MNFHTDTDVRECDDVREELQPYILTQYSGSPTIVQLLSDFRDNIDPQADINLFIEKVMNIDTAEGIGLDILGKIIGMARVVQYGGQTITLTDNLYRRLLMYKAFANISDSTMATMNKMLYLLFGENLMFAKNLIVEARNGDEYYNSFPMHVRFTALRDLTEEEKEILREKLRKYISDKGKILPRRVTGCCAKHQRKVTEAVKRARTIALLPFTVK